MAKLLDRLKSGGRHTVAVTLPIEDEQGAVTNGELKVIYRGVSMEEGKAIEARVEAEPDKRKAMIQALCEAVIEIHDDGEVVKPTPDFFGGLDTFFLNRINSAIHADRQGPNE